MKNYFILIVIIFIFGCRSSSVDISTEEPIIDTGTPTSPITDDDEPIVSVAGIVGKAFKGAFKKRTPILAYLLDSDWQQLDCGPYRGETTSNDGSYQVRAIMEGDYVRSFLGPGDAYNEADGVYAKGVELSMRSINDENPKNFSVLTSIADSVSFARFTDPSQEAYEDPVLAANTGRTETINYFGFSDQIGEELLYNLSLYGDTSGDAALFAASVVISEGKGADGPAINDYIQEIANGVVEGNQNLKAKIADNMSSIKWKKVIDNQKSNLADIGMEVTIPPVLALPWVPDYYELLDREPTVQGEYNINNTTTGSFDSSGYDKFAIPKIFSDIETTQYIAFQMDGNHSIWSVATCNNGVDFPCPGTEIESIEEMAEILLTSPKSLAYNGYLGEHFLENGVQYFHVITKDSEFQPSKAIGGDALPFGKVLALAVGYDDWNNAIGDGANINTTPFFTREETCYTTD